jgi:hypothetical protein
MITFGERIGGRGLKLAWSCFKVLAWRIKKKKDMKLSL